MQAGETAAWRFVREWRRRSPFPFLLVTPVVTLPLTALLILTLGGDVDGGALGLVEVEWVRESGRLDRVHYFYLDFWRTWALLTAPGIVNLLVVWWLTDRLTYARIAAGLALVLAVLRTFVVPVAATLWLNADLIDGAGPLLRIPIADEGDPTWPSPTQAKLGLLTTVWIGGLGMWLITLALWQAYEPVMARFFPRLEPPREQGEEEQRRWSGFARR